MIGWRKLVLVIMIAALCWVVFKTAGERRWGSEADRKTAIGSARGDWMSADDLTVTVSKVGRTALGQYVVLLGSQEQDRVLPIYVGEGEARAIAMATRHLTPPRPMTHDLMKSAIEALGGEIRGILITSIEHSTFLARIVVRQSGKDLLLDARPSDSIALAVRCSAPIAVKKALFLKESIPAPSDEGEGSEEGEVPQEEGPEAPEPAETPAVPGLQTT